VSGNGIHQLGRIQVCTSLQTDNHASTPPLSFLQAGCPSCRPTQHREDLHFSNVYQPIICHFIVYAYTYIVYKGGSVHQAAKLVAALLRVAGVTAGLADSNGSLPPGL